MATKHRVLVIGVGSIGERHLRCFRNTGRAELALCEVNEALRADVARRYGVGRAFGRFEDALAEPHDVAVIATPAPLHVPQATRLAEAGVHLLIEKPLSTSLDETVVVHHGDVFLVPRGYHGPSIAAPGYPLYYLNVMASEGPERRMDIVDDPRYHWVRESWQSS